MLILLLGYPFKKAIQCHLNAHVGFADYGKRFICVPPAVCTQTQSQTLQSLYCLLCLKMSFKTVCISFTDKILNAL